MSKELTRVGVTRMRLWEKYKRDHPDGFGYSQFCHHYQRWARQQKLSMHIEHKYVEFARHYNLAILPARPYKPKDKALVEGSEILRPFEIQPGRWLIPKRDEVS